MWSVVQVHSNPPFYLAMSVKIAIGSRIYDIPYFSEKEQSDSSLSNNDGTPNAKKEQDETLAKLSKGLNFRVNQVIAGFGVKDQEMAVVMAALSLMEELESLQKELSKQPDLFPQALEAQEKTYTKDEVDKILLNTISFLTKKLSKVIEQ